jgi:demethoxyubiquinone hydroxylase (CLK1/Coq7/Cat5 family)
VLPISNYETLTTEEVIKRLDTLSEEQLRTLRDYEIRHQNRAVVIEAIDGRLAAFGGK